MALSVADVLRANDAARRVDVAPAEDLWTLDQLAGVDRGEYGFEVPTLVPQPWVAPPRLSQAEYGARFAALNPFADHVLKSFNGAAAPLGGLRLVVAGGAAALPYCPYERRNDVDFFLVGLDHTSDSVRKAVLDAIMKIIKEHVKRGRERFFDPDEDMPTVTIPGLVMMTVFSSEGARLPEVQIILRAYSNVSQLLHAFDIGSSCIAYDGFTTYMTTMGAYAQWHAVNIVNPAYCSQTYEARLAKYLAANYAVAFPRLGEVGAGRHELPHCVLDVKDAEGRRLAGELRPLSAQPECDYAETLDRGACDKSYALGWSNLAKIAHGKSSYAWGEEVSMLPATLGDLVTPELVDKMMANVVGRALDQKGCNYEVMRRYLAMGDDEILAVVRAALCKEAHPADLLGPHAARVRAAYEERRDAPIEWWIVADPGRQFTAARAPRAMAPAEWYGDHSAAARCGESPAVRPTLYDDALCAICLELITSNIAERLKSCIHVFHKECLTRAIHAGGGCICPSCRGRIVRY